MTIILRTLVIHHLLISGNIGELERRTTKIINSAISDAQITATGEDDEVKIEEIQIDFKSEIEIEEENLEKDLENTRKELEIMRDGCIISQMKSYHPSKYSSIEALVVVFIEEQINELLEDLQAFLSSNPDSFLSKK